MMMMNKAREEFHKFSQYRRTKREIEAMSLDVALDLGIFREDAAKIASRAVYG